jgi:hypothetical protein
MKRTKQSISQGSVASQATFARLILLAICSAVIVASRGGTAISQVSSSIFLRSTEQTSSSLGGNSSLTLARPGAVASGDLLIAQLAVRGGRPTTPPPGWTLIRRDSYGESITQAIYVKAVENPSTEPAQYSWYFDSGTDATVGMADYAGVNSVVANSGAGAASSNFVIAPSVSIPSGGTNDTVIGFFSVAGGEPVVPPAKMTQRWSSRAIGYGIGIGMGDLAMAPGQPNGLRLFRPPTRHGAVPACDECAGLGTFT